MCLACSPNLRLSHTAISRPDTSTPRAAGSTASVVVLYHTSRPLRFSHPSFWTCCRVQPCALSFPLASPGLLLRTCPPSHYEFVCTFLLSWLACLAHLPNLHLLTHTAISLPDTSPPRAAGSTATVVVPVSHMSSLLQSHDTSLSNSALPGSLSYLHLLFAQPSACQTRRHRAPPVPLQQLCCRYHTVLLLQFIDPSLLTSNALYYHSFMCLACSPKLCHTAISLPDTSPPRAAGSTARVVVLYHTSSRSSAVQWLMPSATAGKVHPYLFTQCQAIHARSLLPCQVRCVYVCAYVLLCSAVIMPRAVVCLMLKVQVCSGSRRLPQLARFTPASSRSARQFMRAVYCPVRCVLLCAAVITPVFFLCQLEVGTQVCSGSRLLQTQTRYTPRSSRNVRPYTHGACCPVRCVCVCGYVLQSLRQELL